MGVLATALTNLAAVPVGGVTSYALDATPNALTRAQLPALIILPELAGAAPGLEPNQFSAGKGRLTIRVAHALLLEPVAGGLGMRGAFPALAAAVDAYSEALAADPTLDGALPLPLAFEARMGVVRYADVDYHGAVFTHTWTLFVG